MTCLSAAGPYPFANREVTDRPIVKNDADENQPPNKKKDEKALIPLPPTGFVSLFSAKVEGGAIRAPAQASRGPSQAIGNCTECEVLQRNVIRLHSVQQAYFIATFCLGTGRSGRKWEKLAKRCIFQIGADPESERLFFVGQRGYVARHHVRRGLHHDLVSVRFAQFNTTG